MMGMGKSGQITNGIHFRLRSRAVIVVDNDSNTRLVYVTNNICMTYGGLVQNVTAKLQSKYGDLYGYENVMISGEHTHSGPAGFSTHFICLLHPSYFLFLAYMSLYDVTSFGFHADNLFVFL